MSQSSKEGKVHLAAFVAALLAAALCFVVAVTPQSAFAVERSQEATVSQTSVKKNVITPYKSTYRIPDYGGGAIPPQKKNYLQKHKREICRIITTGTGTLNDAAWSIALKSVNANPAIGVAVSLGFHIFWDWARGNCR